MYKGIFYAISACFVWGLIFVVPLTLSEFSSLEIVVGRYLFFGIFSVFLLGISHFSSTSSSIFKIPLKYWGKAIVWSALAGMGYYLSLVLGLQYIDPPICSLIQGLAPITIACYGNWIQKDCSFRVLLAPFLLVLCGLIFVNMPQFDSSLKEFSFADYLFGVLLNLGALSIWTWFVVKNARFLKEMSEISSFQWSTMLGIGNLICAIVAVFGAVVFFPHWVPAFSTGYSQDLWMLYILGSIVLGIVSGWLGNNLWNTASRLLPVTISGQMMVCETVFGLLFVFLYQQRCPLFIEWLGMGCLLSGVLMSLNKLTQPTRSVALETVH